jgi:release factor glutamine methyltransferase
MLDDLLNASGLPRREAIALLEAATGQRREALIAHGSDPAPREVQALFERMVAQRRLGVPIAYLTGFREFYGRSFWVSPATLIPRIETELLIDTVIDLAQAAERPLRLADLGTGSGCIGITLALEIRSAQITATDWSAAALQVARNNAAQLGAVPQTRFFEGSWFDALPRDRVKYHGLISNPPYVGAGDPHLSQGDLRFEPKAALSPAATGDGTTAQSDGLGDIATLATSAPEWLEPGGFLLVEHGSEQQAAVVALFRQAGLTRVRGLADDQSLPRAVIGFRAS